MNNEQAERTVTITDGNGLFYNHLEVLIVSADCCNGNEWRAFDVFLLPCLRELQVGNHCFQCVEEVRMVGMSVLERVVIGDVCFTSQEGCIVIGTKNRELPQTHVNSVVLLTYHLYHLTPLIEYCLKHPHVWTRSPLFGSFIHTSYAYVYICSHMHSYVLHMLSYGPTGSPPDFICIHRSFI